ncbi:hypothetical protein AGMMS49975_06580 [Clostridia bacterium]|nr:hypothetical protein AGMMS49975_06580 [Clostridia bacterium]
MGNYYDKELLDKLKQTDILDFLSEHCGYSFKQKGRDFSCEHHDSLVIKEDKKRWFWNSKQVGGANALDYLMKIEGANFTEAATVVAKFNNETPQIKSGKSVQKSASKVAETAHGTLVLPEHTNAKYSRLFAYLCQTRGIDKGIVADLIKQDKLYQDKKGNAVFVGFDENNEAKFACVRGTSTDKRFRGDCAGSDKRYAFTLNGTNSEKLYVFESPIDALSHATLANIKSGDKDAWKEHSRLTLDGTSAVALEHYLSKNPQVKELVFCLDNDEAGRTALANFKEMYGDNYKLTRMSFPETCKDVNDFLLKKKEVTVPNRATELQKILQTAGEKAAQTNQMNSQNRETVSAKSAVSL